MPPKPKPVEDRFWPKVNKTETCWLWTGCKDKNGYGRVLEHGRTVRGAHTVAYRMLVGPTPLGYVVDHRCHVTSCVNPEHLRLVTQQKNQENRKGASKQSKTGIRGVSWSSKEKGWVVYVTCKGKTYNGGRYDNIEDAERAAMAKRNELFTHNEKDK